MEYSLGVDLGTTFVAAAIARDDGRLEMVTLGDRSVAIPAVVLLRSDGELVFGDAAARRAASNPGDVAAEIKRRLGDPTPVRLGGAARPATELLGAELRDVIARVALAEGRAARRVVLTHPANWGPFRRGLFEDVAAFAGLEDPPMIAEPEAAGVHYASTRDLADGDLIAVYDLGGGTFDASVLRKTADGVELVGTPEGIERLGGVDFDEAILAHVDHATGGALGDLDMGDATTTAALARLRQDCVLAKEALSVDEETTVPVFIPGRHVDVTITRSEFEDMVRAPVESSIGALRRTLRSASVTPDQLSAVLLVGGSSRIPMIARTVGEELGCRTVVDSHPKHAVALGAAIVAGRRHGVVASGGAPSGAAGSATPPVASPPAAAASSSAKPTATPPAADDAATTTTTTEAARTASPATPAASTGAGGPSGTETTTIAARGPSPARPGSTGTPPTTRPAHPPKGPPTPSPPPPTPARGARRYPETRPGAGTGARPAPAPAYGPPRRGPGGAQAGNPARGHPPPTTGRRGAPPTARPQEVDAPTTATRADPAGPTTRVAGPPPDQPTDPRRRPGGADGRPLPGPPPLTGAAGRPPPPLRAPDSPKASRSRVIILTIVAVLAAAAVAAVVLIATGVLGPVLAGPGGSEPESPALVAASIPVPTEVNRVAVGATPGFVALSPDGRVAFVANREAKTITVVDTATAAVTATVPVAVGPPQYLTPSPDGARLYVSVFDQQRTIAAVAVLDTATNEVCRDDPGADPSLRLRGDPRRFPALGPQPRLRHGERDRHRHGHRGRGPHRGPQPALGGVLAGRVARLHREPRVQPDLGDRHREPDGPRAGPGRDESAQRRGEPGPTARGQRGL